MDSALSLATPPSSSSSATAWACFAGVGLERDLDLDEAFERLADEGTIVWIDLCDPAADELTRLRDELGVHPVAIEHILAFERRPQVTELRSQLFASLLFALPSRDGQVRAELSELDLVVGANYVVTVHRDGRPLIEEAADRWTAGGSLLSEGLGYLLFNLLDTILDTYLPLVESVEDAVEEIEEGIFGRMRQDAIENLVEIRRTVLKLRRALMPLRELTVPLLARWRGHIGDTTLPYVRDLDEHVRRVVELFESERDRIDGTLDAWLAMGSHRLNETMRRLTVISVVTGFIACVFGAWGMNVAGLPLETTTSAFAMIVGATTIVVAALVRAALRMRWL